MIVFSHHLYQHLLCWAVSGSDPVGIDQLHVTTNIFLYEFFVHTKTQDSNIKTMFNENQNEGGDDGGRISPVYQA